jgi:hypothetical protein
MTAIATLSLLVALALVAFVSYQAGVTTSDYRHETARMKRRWKFDSLADEVLRKPFDGILGLSNKLFTYVSVGVANVIDKLVTAIHTERTRATRLHRRAQKAEGLLARRKAKLERERDRARKLHRRAQKAEGELQRVTERLKWHCFKCSEEAREAGSATVKSDSEDDRELFAWMQSVHVPGTTVLAERPVKVASRKVRDEITFDDATAEAVEILKMPPIQVNGYWTSALTAGGNAFDVLPAAKPLSALPDIFRPIDPPTCGDMSPGNWDDPDDFPVRCSREKGHEGKHAGGTRCGTIEWGLLEPTKPVVKVGS